MATRSHWCRCYCCCNCHGATLEWFNAVDYVADGKIVEHDTVNVELCDEYGDWGGSGLGKLFQKQMLIKERVPVGRYDKIVVWHNMRVSKVTNVTDVGLTYIKSK